MAVSLNIPDHYTIADSAYGCIQKSLMNDIPSLISCDRLEVGGVDIASAISKINERLLILEPKKELLAKYESLRNAYDHYKLMEALLTEES